MATGARGEGYLEADGERYSILFTNRALADGEAATGKSIMQLMSKFTEDAVSIGDVAQLLTVGLEHSRRETHSRPQVYKLPDAYDLMDKVGFADAALAVMEAITTVMSYRSSKGSDNPPA